MLPKAGELGRSYSSTARRNFEKTIMLTLRDDLRFERDGSAALVSIMYLIYLTYLYKEIVYPQRVNVQKGI